MKNSLFLLFFAVSFISNGQEIGKKKKSSPSSVTQEKVSKTNKIDKRVTRTPKVNNTDPKVEGKKD